MSAEATKLRAAANGFVGYSATQHQAGASLIAAALTAADAIERLERERCTCDEETGLHDPMCVLAVRETARSMAARIAALEAECATAREVSRILDGFRGDPPTPSQWAHICEMAYLLRLKLGASAARKQ